MKKRANYSALCNHNSGIPLTIPMKQLLITLFLLSSLALSCKKTNPDYKKTASDATFLRKTEVKVTEVMVHDIFSPPVASRIYVYASLAAYEALVPSNPQYRSMAGGVGVQVPSWLVTVCLNPRVCL